MTFTLICRREAWHSHLLLFELHFQAPTIIPTSTTSNTWHQAKFAPKDVSDRAPSHITGVLMRHRSYNSLPKLPHQSSLQINHSRCKPRLRLSRDSALIHPWRLNAHSTPALSTTQFNMSAPRLSARPSCSSRQPLASSSLRLPSPTCFCSPRAHS